MSKRKHEGVQEIVSTSKSSSSEKNYKIIGTPRPKVDAYSKVTGRALYADDIMLPRMVYGRLLRSPHAHARIVAIDTSKALALPRGFATEIWDFAF